MLKAAFSYLKEEISAEQHTQLRPISLQINLGLSRLVANKEYCETISSIAFFPRFASNTFTFKKISGKRTYDKLIKAVVYRFPIDAHEFFSSDLNNRLAMIISNIDASCTDLKNTIASDFKKDEFMSDVKSMINQLNLSE